MATNTIPFNGSSMIVDRVSHGTVSVSASSSVSVSVDASKTGYSVIGCVGYNTYRSGAGSNWNNVVLVRMIQSSQTIACVFRNVSTSDATIELVIDVLYKKN